MAFGSTNAPVEISETWGADGDDGRDARTTLAKCVGTATFGGLPIISYVLKENNQLKKVGVVRAKRTTRHFPSGSLWGRYNGMVNT